MADCCDKDEHKRERASWYRNAEVRAAAVDTANDETAIICLGTVAVVEKEDDGWTQVHKKKEER